MLKKFVGLGFALSRIVFVYLIFAGKQPEVCTRDGAAMVDW